MTAGLGRRLAPLTAVRAKPAVPVAGEPLVRRIARWLGGEGITELVLNLHHLPASITRRLGDGSDLGLRVRYSWEQPTLLGTAGGPRQALDILETDPFLIVNGDTITNVNLRDLAAVHAASGALVTLAITPNRAPDRYTGLRFDDNWRLRPGVARRGREAIGSFHFLGVQVVQADALAWLPGRRAVDSIGDAYATLLSKRPGSIAGYLSEASFEDIGTIPDYWRTSCAFIARHDGAWSDGSAVIAPGARVVNSLLWDDVRVDAGASLDDCIVTDGVHVPAGASYRRAVLRTGDGGAIDATPFEPES
jgi:NDP-sugar pyrophosphorylase family protein